MTAVLVTSDLTVVSRVEGAAASAGISLRPISNPAEAANCAAENQASLVILDLSAPSLDVHSLVAELRALSPKSRIVAFGPHVHAERLAEAREAGCDEVISRGQFFSRLDGFLRADAD